MGCSLSQLVYETEIKANENTENIIEMILEKIKQMSGFSCDAMKSTVFIADLLMRPNFPYRTLLLRLLEKYQANERDLLLYLTANLYTFDNPMIIQMQRIISFLSLPYIDTMSCENNHYQIKTKYGTIETYCLEDWFLKHKIDFDSGNFRKVRCHYAVEVLSDKLKEEEITTSELKGLFGGNYYYSYYTLKDGEGVIDPTRNIFYSGSCFEDVFKPNVLLQYPAKELEARYQDYQEIEVTKDRGLDKVLALALNQKRKLLK